jgi:hypothetical protein
MLNSRIADLHEMVWDAATKVGNSPPRISDAIIETAFPRTYSEAKYEGADKILRNGLINEVNRIISKCAPAGAEQIDMAEKFPGFGDIIRSLKSRAYYVVALGEKVPVENLINSPELLDDARKHMRQKGEECLAEADTLDQLYIAVTGDLFMAAGRQ